MSIVRACYRRPSAYVRGPLLANIRKLPIRQFGVAWWSSHSSQQINALLLDCTYLKCQITSSVENCLLGRLETLCKQFCHKLHMKRLQLHQKLNL